MKKTTFLFTSLLCCGLMSYAQQRRTNPALDSLCAITDPKALQQKLSALGNGTEQDLSLLSAYYSKSPKSADSVSAIIMQRFPKGKFVQGKAFSRFINEDNPNRQEEIFLQMQKDFPDRDFSSEYYFLATAFADAKQSDKALKYFEETKGKFRSRAFSPVVGALIDSDIDKAAKFVNTALASSNLSQVDRIPLLELQSKIWLKMGNYVKAFAVVKEYYPEATKTAALNAHYFYLMSKAGDYQQALSELEKMVIAGEANAEVKEGLELAYGKLNPGKNVNAYIAGLTKRLVAKEKEDAVKSMLKQKAPDFVVTDQNGKTVSLADYKGKTIVLDFWATWCGPCKASLPAMQNVVNKYKNDPNVKFLFIHTWEKVADPTADAKKYLADNHYELPLFMDLKDPATKVNKAVAAFGVKGIPAKFIIDGNGFIRFNVSGFGGATEKAIAELSAMIELSKS